MTMAVLPRVLLLASTIAASTTTIDWNAQFSADPKTTTVADDADLVFSWTGGHDVWEMADEAAYDACDFSGGTDLGSSSGVAVSAQAGETVYYSCSVGSHCASGQKVAVTWDSSSLSSTGAPTSSPVFVEYAGACQSSGAYPSYCTEAEANAVGDGTSHAHGGVHMPNGVSMYHGDYPGDADECACDDDADDHAHDDGHDHDHGDDPTDEEADGAAPRALAGLAGLAALGLAAL